MTMPTDAQLLILYFVVMPIVIFSGSSSRIELMFPVLLMILL